MMKYPTNFVKGGVPWNKGKKATLEHRRKISEALKGKKHSEETKQKLRLINKGKKPTKDQIVKMVATRMRNGSYKQTPEHRLKISNAGKGRKISQKTIDAMTEGRRKNPLSQEKRKQISEKLKKYFANQDNRKKLSDTLLSLNRKPWSTGKTFSSEHRLKISNAKKGKPLSKEHKENISKAHSKPEVKEKQRQNRLNQVFPLKDTLPERIMQIALRLEKIEFETHKPILGQPDIFIEPNVCIFVDGDYWHANPQHYRPNDKKFVNKRTAKQIWIKDRKIDRHLRNEGFIVLRLWESLIKIDAIFYTHLIKHCLPP